MELDFNESIFENRLKDLKIVRGEKITNFTKESLNMTSLEGESLYEYILTFEDTENIDSTKTIEIALVGTLISFSFNYLSPNGRDCEFKELNGKRLLDWTEWHLDTITRPINILDIQFEDDFWIQISGLEKVSKR